MLSYQHMYHAGNLADVHKHTLLASLLQYFCQQSHPLYYIETHAGRGLYNLNSAEAKKTNEAANGLLKLEAANTPLPAPYAKVLKRARSAYGPHAYPGSPLMAAMLLRKQDEAHLHELHPKEAAALAQTFTKAPTRLQPPPKLHTTLYQKDGLSHAHTLLAALANTQQKTKNIFIFIDPSYEVKEEYTTLAQHIKTLYTHHPKACIALWYPLLPAGLHTPLLAALEKLPHTNHQVMFKNLPNHRLAGSGMLLINPPAIVNTWANAAQQLF